MLLDKALCLLDHHLGNLNVPCGLLIEGGGNDLTLYVASHVGNLLRALVDEQHEELDFRMVRRDRIGNLLHQDSLTCSGRCDDEGALSLTDRAEEIDNSGCNVHVLGLLGIRYILKVQFLIGEKRGKRIEGNTELCHLGRVSVYGHYAEHGVELIVLPRGPDLTEDGISGSEAAASYHA